MSEGGGVADGGAGACEGAVLGPTRSVRAARQMRWKEAQQERAVDRAVGVEQLAEGDPPRHELHLGHLARNPRALPRQQRLHHGVQAGVALQHRLPVGPVAFQPLLLLRACEHTHRLSIRREGLERERRAR